MTPITRSGLFPVLPVLPILLFLALPARPVQAQTKASKTPAIASVFQDTLAASRLASELQADLLTAIEAEKSAVLAERPDAIQPSVSQAREAAERVERGRLELETLLARRGRNSDKALLAEFSRAWAEFQSIDRELLDLASENTNKLAANLSRGAATQSATRLEQALKALMEGCSDSPQAPALTRRASELVIACLKILSLEAPHIAEADDARMDAIEAEMAARSEQGDKALEFLARSVPPTAQASLSLAGSAWSEFLKINAEVLTLSRRNTDVRSLALSLGRKRVVAAQCAAAIQALSESLLERQGKATR